MKNIKSHHIFLVCFLGLIALFASANAQQINHGQIELEYSKTKSSSQLKASASVISSQTLAIPLINKGKVLAIGFILESDQSLPAFHLELASAAKENNFDSWEELPNASDAEFNSLNFHTHLFFLDPSTQYIRFRIRFNSPQKDLPELTKIKLFFTSPLSASEEIQATSVRKENEIEELPRPSYVNRKEWGCPQPENIDTRELTDVSHLVLHHSAGNTNSDNYADVVLSYWDYHVNGHGWDDIGYNWLVSPDGYIFKGRAWYNETQENVKGAHNSGKNSGTSGICMIGNYTNGNLPSSLLWNSTYEILAFLCSKFSLDPLGITHHEAIAKDNYVISGHGDSGGGTACPGDVALSYESIRNAVAAIMDGSYKQGPSDMLSEVSECPDLKVKFDWTNTGNKWRIHLSEDSNFKTHYVKWVSNLDTYTGPEGFVLAPDESEALTELKDNITYYWRINYDGSLSPTYSFETPDCSSSSISNLESKTPVLKVYPNPSNGIFNIEFQNKEIQSFNIQLYNSSGVLVYSNLSNSNPCEIELEYLATGLYVLHIRGKDISYKRKLLIVD